MREKRYYKDMKGTQEQKKERYPFLDELPLKRKAIREINEREGGFEGKEREGKGDNKGSFCKSWSRIEGNGKRELYNGF